MEDKLEWLTSKRQDLVELHRGKWVVIDIEHNKVFASEDVQEAIDSFSKEHPGETPHIFKIPVEAEELCAYYGLSV